MKLQQLSRILFLFFIFVLSGCSIINNLRMGQINSDLKPEIISQMPIDLKSKFIGEKPYIYAKANGVELLFLLDTGARFPILFDTPKVKKLELSRGFDLVMKGWGDEVDSQAFQTTIEELDLGGVKFTSLKAAFIPMSQTLYYLREDEAIFDGVIGYDILNHFSWLFDKSQNKIALSHHLENERHGFDMVHNTEALEMDIFLGKITVDGNLTFNSSHVNQREFIIDTGSRHYLKISAHYINNEEIEIDSPRIVAADFGLNGRVEHERITLPNVTFGNLSVDNVKVNLIPNDDEDEDDFSVVGNAFLNQFEMIIDYPNKRVYLTPIQAFNTKYNLIGLELRKIRSGDFVIRYIFPEFPSSKGELQVGDIITGINGVSSQDISVGEMLTISSEAESKEVCIRRKSKCLSVNVKEINGYSVGF